MRLYHMIRKGQNAFNTTLPAWKQFYALAGLRGTVASVTFNENLPTRFA